jgi:hypothetical protein
VKKLLVALVLLAALIPVFLYHLDSHVLGERKRMAARHVTLSREAVRVERLYQDEKSQTELERLEEELDALADAYNALPAPLLRSADLPLSLPRREERRDGPHLP